ncbi:YcxB family protein [Microbacterium sp. PMB16]|uniref:YcxB family protein n=1 Tax=Microbacterium sp. PMB16 TaxID=3120157 RepID=UPI003F4C255F
MPPRSLTVDQSLLRRMARDAAIYSLTRPVAIVMWVLLAAALVVSILNLTGRVVSEQEENGFAAWMPPLVIALAVAAVVMTVSSARHAVRVAMPPESVVWVLLEDEVLQVGSGDRRSTIAYRTFQGIRVGTDAVLLKLRDASVVTAVPRALLSDEDIANLRSKIA